MKLKLIIFIFITLIFSSCIDNNSEKNYNNIDEISGSIYYENIEKETNEPKSKEETYIKEEKFNNELNDLIKKLTYNPDILSDIDCSKFKKKETLDFCNNEKSSYLKILNSKKEVKIDYDNLEPLEILELNNN